MRALLSVSDKSGIEVVGKGLLEQGFELVSTGGTHGKLFAAGLPVTAVSAVTGFPEMLDGRVKTLHPKIHAGILARRGREGDMKELVELQIELIDAVIVNLYPFEAAAKKTNIRFDALMEEVDIGGPSMVRAAAKSWRDVFVVVDPADYLPLLEALTKPRRVTEEFRFELMRKAFAHTAAYDTAISKQFNGWDIEDGEVERKLVML
jgi:phosphoribosylaminoimidazolecarboxamide formyltransferase/IMP cyclohydrolase